MSDLKLIYPTVDLFLYDLRDGLGQGTTVKRNRINFWRKIDAELDRQIQELVTVNPQENAGSLSLVDSPLDKKLKELEAKENSEADYEILCQKKFDEEASESHLDGYYFATQLQDTYALIVESSGSYTDIETKQKSDRPQPIETVSQNQQIVISHVNHEANLSELKPEKNGTIGQSWFVWGQLPDGSLNPREVAAECYQQLNPNTATQPNFREAGNLAGAMIFEYWHLPKDWGQKWENFSQENHHFIVCLFPPNSNPEEIKANRQKVQRISFAWARLLCYRHKVIWAYWQSRRLKKELKQQSVEIKNLVDKVKGIGKEIESPKSLNLRDLQLTITAALPLLSNYAVNLESLADQGRTIALNRNNYYRRLEQIERQTNSNLELLKRFNEIAEDKYQRQIESDYINLSPELQVLENIISTVRGIVDIEQAKSDRDLNVTIATVGTALAVSGVVATVAGDSPPKSHFDLSLVKSPSFALSIFPVAIALLILSWRRWRRR